MLRIGPVLAMAMTAAVFGGGQALAQNTGDCVTDASLSMPSTKVKVATAEQPALVSAGGGPEKLSDSSAVRLTLRPTAVDPGAPFLVQVFAKGVCDAKPKEHAQLLGVVAFYPLKLGKAQEFVFAAPKHGFPAVQPEDVEFAVKLVPVNPDRPLDNASLEVVNARFTK